MGSQNVGTINGGQTQTFTSDWLITNIAWRCGRMLRGHCSEEPRVSSRNAKAWKFPENVICSLRKSESCFDERGNVGGKFDSRWRFDGACKTYRSLRSNGRCYANYWQWYWGATNLDSCFTHSKTCFNKTNDSPNRTTTIQARISIPCTSSFPIIVRLSDLHSQAAFVKYETCAEIYEKQCQAEHHVRVWSLFDLMGSEDSLTCLR